MTTPTDQLSPDTLEKYFRSGTVTVHHVNDSPEVDITIDGADEADRSFRLIKGGGVAGLLISLHRPFYGLQQSLHLIHRRWLVRGSHHLPPLTGVLYTIFLSYVPLHKNSVNRRPLAISLSLLRGLGHDRAS